MDCYFTKPIRLVTLQKIISDVVSADPLETLSELSPVLKELFETLGREKVLGVSKVFFEELSHFIQQCNQGIFSKDNHALAEATHKIKGAAAMLGLDLLETTFAQLESDAREGNVRDLTNRIQSLDDFAKKSEAMFDHYVSLSIK